MAIVRLLGFLAAGGAHAADVPSPGAGTLLQDLKPLAPPPRSNDDAALSLEPAERADLPASAPFTVNLIKLRGNTAFATAVLHALIAEAEHRQLTLPALGAYVARISDFYHRHGYPLARAVIPPQSIQDGSVDVEIVEARYDRIVLDNTSRVRAGLLNAIIAPLQPGGLIEQSQLERVLLSLADVPGVAVDATLRPGSVPGTSELALSSAASAQLAGVASLDNSGNRYTGRTRFSGEVVWYDPLRHGDALDASLLSSGSDLNYGRLSYDTLLNGVGTHLGGSYSALSYRLGHTLAALDAHGTARVGDAWLRQPVVRSRTFNLYAQIQFEHKELGDDVGVSDTRTERHLDDLTVSLSTDWRDDLGSGATNSGSVQVLRGRVGFDNDEARLSDAITARTAGDFTQWNVTLARLQRLGPRDSLYVAVAGQGSGGNLDSSQKMVAGGRYTVRSYDMSALSGDEGVQATTEWRHDLKFDWGGQWQTLGFFDAQRVMVNRSPWTAGLNHATLRGAGGGLTWSGQGRWSAKAYAATRLGAAPQLAGDASSVRAWFEISKGF